MTATDGAAPPTNEVVVVAPVYRSTTDAFETLSLDRAFAALRDRPIVMIKPRGLDTAAVENGRPFAAVETFDPSYFRSIKDYNRLLLSTEFYERFASYRYLLICQLDVFVFRDDLSSWAARGYDYVGAPWLSKTPVSNAIHWFKMRVSKAVLGEKDRVYRYETRNRVGNGGFSLRNVETHLRLSVDMKPHIDHYLANQDRHHFNEDIFWSIEPSKKGFPHRTPSVEEAFSFAFDINPARLYRLAGRRLPMAAHGWERPGRLKFWRPFVEACGVSLPR